MAVVKEVVEKRYCDIDPTQEATGSLSFTEYVNLNSYTDEGKNYLKRVGREYLVQSHDTIRAEMDLCPEMAYRVYIKVRDYEGLERLNNIFRNDPEKWEEFKQEILGMDIEY